MVMLFKYGVGAVCKAFEKGFERTWPDMNLRLVLYRLGQHIKMTLATINAACLHKLVLGMGQQAIPAIFMQANNGDVWL